MADLVLERMEMDLFWQSDSDKLLRYEAYRDGVKAIYAQNYVVAADKFKLGLSQRINSDRDLATMTFLTFLSSSQTNANGADRAKVIQALALIVPPGF